MTVRHPSDEQHKIKCQICKFCLVLCTINSCFPLYPQMPPPAKGSFLAFGTSKHMHEFGIETECWICTEFVVRTLGKWQGFGSAFKCSPALFEENSRGSLTWIKLSSKQLNSFIWGQRKVSCFIRTFLGVLAPTSIPMMAIYEGHGSAGNVFLILWLFVYTKRVIYLLICWGLEVLSRHEDVSQQNAPIWRTFRRRGGASILNRFYNLCRSADIDEVH